MWRHTKKLFYNIFDILITFLFKSKSNENKFLFEKWIVSDIFHMKTLINNIFLNNNLSIDSVHRVWHLKGVFKQINFKFGLKFIHVLIE